MINGFGLHLTPQDEVQVLLSTLGAVRGIVRWARGNRFGIETIESLDISQLIFRSDTNILASPPPFSVSEQHKPSSTTYRPSLRIKR
jgi:hypothetical protein